jgi:transcriptional regulator with XRE-family HTH domain
MAEQKGEFRNLTPAEIGKAVVNFRKMSGMKQITLAHEARVTERTIQRIEQGEKVNDETLRQVAQALRLKPDSFIGPRYVRDEADARAHAEKMLAEVFIINANDLVTLKDCAAVLSTDGYFVDDRSAGDELAHQIAVLRDTLQDWGDMYREISHTEKLAACESVMELIREMENAGYGFRYGVYKSDDDFDISVLLILPKKDIETVPVSQMIVPRNFARLALESLRH